MINSVVYLNLVVLLAKLHTVVQYLVMLWNDPSYERLFVGVVPNS